MSSLRALTPRDRMVLMVVVLAAAIVGSWLLVVQPKRSEASKLGDQLKVAQTQLQTAQQQVQAGLAAKASFARSYTQLARLGEAVPADDNVPSMILQLQNAAATDHVDFRTLDVSADSSSSTTPTAATTTQAVTGTLPPGAAVGSAGFPIESFTFTFRGNFFHLSSFLGRVQRFVVTKNHQVTVSGRLLTLNAISHGRRTRGLPPDHRDDLRHRVPRADVAGRDGGRDRGRAVDRVKRLDEREHLGLQLRNHHARRRRDLPDSMNFLQPLITDLREKRLWPVVVVLVGALVAVPVLLAKPAPKPEPAIAATGAGATITSPISGLPVVELSTTPQFSHLPGHGRDPFTQQTSTTSTSSTASTSTSVSSSSGGTTSTTGSHGSSSSTGSNAGGGGTTGNTGSSTTTTQTTTTTTPVTPPGLTPTESYGVTIAITKPSGGLDTIAPVERLTPLPSGQQPLLIELGVLKGGSAVLFVVAPGTSLSGPAKCLPGRIDCQIISLAPNQIESLSVKGANGPATSPTLPSPASPRSSHKSAADAGRVRRQVSKTGPEAAQVFPLRRALVVPVRAERRRDRRSTQPDIRGKLMRRMMLIAFTFVVISLLGAASAGAVVIDMGALRADTASPSSRRTRSTLTTAGITTVTAGAPCTDPWLASDFILQSSGLCYNGGPVMHANETFAVTWDPHRLDWQTTRNYVEQFLKDVADGSSWPNKLASLSSQYSLTSQYRDAGGRASYSLCVRRRLRGLRSAGWVLVQVSERGRHRSRPQRHRQRLPGQRQQLLLAGPERRLGDERQRVLHHRRPDPDRGLADGRRDGADRTHADKLHAADRPADAARRRRLPGRRRQDLLGERRLHRPVLLLPRADERRRHFGVIRRPAVDRGDALR